MRIYVACLASYNAGKLHGRWIDAAQGIEGIREEVAEMLRESPKPNVMVYCPECLSEDALAALADFHNGGEATPGMAPCGCFKCTALGQRFCGTCNGRRAVPSAEEYAIHDYEDFGPWRIGEYESLETVAAVAEVAEQSGTPEAFLAWMDDRYSSPTPEDADTMLSEFQDDYCGEWSSEVAYAEDLVDDMGYLNPPKPAHAYDYERRAAQEAAEFLSRYFDYEAFARDLFINDYHSVDAPGGVYVFRRS